MGWSQPRDWTVGEVVTKAMMDVHVKDNLKYLKGESGAVTLSDALILPDGAGYYLHIPSLTTAQRDALTPTAGMLIYNSTTAKFNKYENGAWRADLAYNGDISLLQIASQAEGDILYRGASTWARLAAGTALQLLRMNAGVTAPEWVSLGITHVEIVPVSKATIPVTAWTDWDLSGSVPAGTVLVDISAQAGGGITGVRKNGSAVERSIHPGTTTFTLTYITEVDANRVVECYDGTGSTCTFVLTGYWI